MASLRVDPKGIRFTTASIAVTFETSPLKGIRIDNTVDLLVSENWPSNKCPILPVISYDNVLWNLHNQWLWVYRKAKFAQIDVVVLEADADQSHDAFFARVKTVPDVACFLAAIRRPQKMARMKSEMFFPVVKGEWNIDYTDGVFKATNAPMSKPQLALSSQEFVATITASRAQPAHEVSPCSAPVIPASDSGCLVKDQVEEVEPLVSESAPVEDTKAEAVVVGKEEIISEQGNPVHCNAPTSIHSNTSLSVQDKSDLQDSTPLHGPYTLPDAVLQSEMASVQRVMPGIAVQSHQPVDQRISEPLVEVTSSETGFCDGPSPESDLQVPPPELRLSPDDHDSEAFLAAISTAAMHGLTFTVPVSPRPASNLFSDLSSEAI